jgi:menaquinone-specific isochorismate synthase
MSTATAARTDAELSQAATLVARTIRLPDDVQPDLIAVGGGPGAVLWQREGGGLAGRGEALKISFPDGLDGDGATEPGHRVAAVLNAIVVEDEVGRPGCGPVAIGALPFDRRATASLSVPSVITGRAADGTAWMTTVAPVGSRPAGPAGQTLATLSSLAPSAPPDGFSLLSGRPQAEWCGLVEQAVAAIRAGRLAKVVLAREVLVEANRQLVPVDILRRLHALYPSCMLFAVDGFVGASPELLVSRIGPEIASHPLAGTIPHSGDPKADQRAAAGLLASPKEQQEHRLVVDAVAGVLGTVCDRLDVPVAPSIVSLRNVSHLGTLITGRLTGRATPGTAEPSASSAPSAPSALELVGRLHPTPAVAGTPTADALAYLREEEGFDRGRYAGPVGWMDRNGDGAWAVGIRSAEIRGHRARLFAGVGVVADSEPESELAETQLKLQALLAAVVRP